MSRQRKPDIVKICKGCGDEYLVRPWDSSKFCSILCANRSIERKGYHWAGKYITICLGCGKEMEFKHYCTAESRKFCSSQCRGQAQKAGKVLVGNQYGKKKLWTSEEDARLLMDYPFTGPSKQLCEMLRRTECEVANRAKKLGISRCLEALSKEYASGGRKNVGRPRPDLIKRNRETPRFGVDNPFYGKTHTPEVKKRISEVIKRCQEDPEFHRKRFETMRRNGIHKECPNEYERRLTEILNEMFPGEYKFVGDWSFIVNRKNPDFVNVNGQKKIIEVFGEIYHDPASSPWEVSEDRTESGRKRLFREYGYKTLVVWCKEFSDEQKLRASLREFHEET